MSRFVFIVLVFISQNIFAAYDGEREIVQLTKELSDQTRYLQQTMDHYTKYNRNYWSSNHNKEEELKLLFDIHNFIASMSQFNELIDRNKIDYTYFELPHAFYRVLEDFVDVDEQIKLLGKQRRNRREFDRHFNLHALRRDAEDIQGTLQRLNPVIQRIRPPKAAITTLESVQPKQEVTIEAVTLFKKDSRKPKYKVIGSIIGEIQSARIVVQRSFTGPKQYDIDVKAEGKFVAYFRNYWNASSVTLEVQFSNGESYSKEIDVN